MSALLLDTHIWLWYAEGDRDRLPAASVKRIEDARRNEGLLVSAISVWELGILHAKGRVQLSSPLRDWVQRALKPSGISLATLDADTAAESTLLPGEPHGDPADRFLVATARIRDVVLATRDREVIEYGKAGHVRVLKL
ncbi:MAG: type II toxin-antitoxin system VapC family toxin [Bryobacterales bacterium]|nr:type II toxin-antitoxin system VapC family toxin [Bryobacterales bacterium]